MELRKILVLVTLFFGMSWMFALGIYHAVTLPTPVVIDTTNQPSIGEKEAPVEFVLFEDFQCYSCQLFSQTIFPLIKLYYVDSGKARFVQIPLAFMKNSKILGNAALAVNEISPDKYFEFADKIFKMNDPSPEKLLTIAKEVGGIDLDDLEKAMESRAFYDQLDQNETMAEDIMGNSFATPSLYIDGIKTSTKSFEAIEARFERIVNDG